MSQYLQCSAPLMANAIQVAVPLCSKVTSCCSLHTTAAAMTGTLTNKSTLFNRYSPQIASLAPFHIEDIGWKDKANVDIECHAFSAARLLHRSFPVEGGCHLSPIINVSEPHIRACSYSFSHPSLIPRLTPSTSTHLYSHLPFL